MNEGKPHYHVFLSHNSLDKGAVEPIAVLLREKGLNPFLDKWNLVPGEPIEDALIEALENSDSAVIFVGPGGDGPWQSEEMRDILKRAVKSHNEFRAIPVLLPNASADALEKSFLGSRLWIEFKDVDDDDALLRLAKAIQGEAYGDESFNLPDEPAPYRGLERFERIEKPEEDFFFGRDDEIRALVERLLKERFVAVVGASGSGKSSLIRAGLTKQLAEEIHPGIRRWQTITVEPGSAPFRSLAVQIAVAAGIGVADRESWIEQTVEKWRASPDGVRTSLDALFADAKEPLLVFIDQFEELFTHRLEGQENERISRNFVANLADLWRNGGDRVRVVLALRADFVESCLEIGELKELLQDRTMLVGEVGDDALREIVKEPAARVGAFLEKGLMERILTEVRNQSGSLPLLQQALHELWRQRRGAWLTHEAFDASGGVARALNDQAQGAYKSLDDAQKKIADSLFPRLITLGEGVADTRRRVKRNELYPQGLGPGAVNAVIDTLSGKDARILVTTREGGTAEDLGSGEDFVEFTHEALLGNWDHLITLLDSERESMRKHRSLTLAAEVWESKPEAERQNFLLHHGQLEIIERWAKDEGGDARLNKLERRFLDESIREREAEETRKARTARRLKLLSVGMTALALVALAIGGWAFILKGEAEEQTQKAEKQTQEARIAKNEAVPWIIRATWRSGSEYKPEPGYVTGVRKLIEHADSIINLEKVRFLAPVPIFISGPHGSKFNWNSNEFGHYNPEFVRWASDHLIPGAGDPIFRAATQSIYDTHLKTLAHAYCRSYQALHHDREAVEKLKADYLERLSTGSTDNFFFEEMFYQYSGAMERLRPGLFGAYSHVAAPFWIRREIDGSADEFIHGIRKVLETYDKAYAQECREMSRPLSMVMADVFPGVWLLNDRRNRNFAIFRADGGLTIRRGAKTTEHRWQLLGPKDMEIDGRNVTYVMTHFPGDLSELPGLGANQRAVRLHPEQQTSEYGGKVDGLNVTRIITTNGSFSRTSPGLWQGSDLGRNGTQYMEMGRTSDGVYLYDELNDTSLKLSFYGKDVTATKGNAEPRKIGTIVKYLRSE